VQLVLEMLLLSWPNPQVKEITVTSPNYDDFLMEAIAESRWDWLLLMCALLQQTSTEQKQQFLRERGLLLMQLLYQALLEDEGLGADDIDEVVPSGVEMASGDTAWHSWFLAVTNNMGNLMFHGEKQWTGNVPSGCDHGAPEPAV
jgi:hypothetical protein